MNELKEKELNKLIKLKNYKGSIVVNWKPPKSNKAVIFGIRKLLKLFYRCQSAKLLTSELLGVIKQYANILKEKALVKLVAYPELIVGLKEVNDYKLADLEIELVQEKMRVTKKEICSICGVNLVKPAYLIHRKGTQVVHISKPIGIRDLNAIYGKIRDLITALSIENIENQEEMPKKIQKESGKRVNKIAANSNTSILQFALFY